MNWEKFYSQTSRTLAAKVRRAVALPSREAARLPATGLAGDTSVTVRCYNEEERWNSRYLAYHYYNTGWEACDGSEAERYMNIATKLLMGMDFIDDSDNFDDRAVA
ncbi:MAG: hypothetical protein ACI4CE_07380 [Methanomethylophilus alvi]